MFALVDANAFYCSAEQVFNPAWRGKPLIVLSNNDGCVVAANQQALALGIQKFQPYFKMRALCQAQGIIVCSSNYELYADLSHKMMQVIGRFAPSQHIYSIDESFLSFHDCHLDEAGLLEQGKLLRRAVWKETRLAVCVGFGETLTRAKLANHIAKKQRQYAGVCVFDQLQQRPLLTQLAVDNVWGIGRKTSVKLQGLGIDNIDKLIQLNPASLSKGLNVEVARTINELNGIACIDWDVTRADKIQIFSTRSVGERITSLDHLLQALAKHTAIAAAKARAQHSVCGTLIAFANSSPFDVQPQSIKVIHHFSPASNDSSVLIASFRHAVTQQFNKGARYYKIGVGLLNLSSTRHQQLDLFTPTQKNSALMQVLDNINQRYGNDSAFIAAQGTEQKWAMRRQLLSPQYTTRWADIPKINCE